MGFDSMIVTIYNLQVVKCFIIIGGGNFLLNISLDGTRVRIYGCLTTLSDTHKLLKNILHQLTKIDTNISALLSAINTLQQFVGSNKIFHEFCFCIHVLKISKH